MTLKNKIHVYQVSVIFSMLFALLGFSYNTWRLEVTEENSNYRIACFEILKELSTLEQLIYTAHYDQETAYVSPRKGWVKVGLIRDLSYLTNSTIQSKTAELHASWSNEWQHIDQREESVQLLVKNIDGIRSEVKHLLQTLE